MKKFLFFILIALIFSCKQNSKAEDVQFRFPIISQETVKDSLLDFYAESIQYANLIIATKSMLCDSVKVPSLGYTDTSLKKDRIETVDKMFDNDSIGTDGLEMYCDYKKSVYKYDYDNKKLCSYYPIYLFNGTGNLKTIRVKDNSAFGIQEALDSTGTWHPIEGKGMDFCGNGSWNATLNPQEFLMLLAPKYKGNYATKLRMRIKVGPSIYVSQPYEGKINYNQFYISKDSYFLEYIKEDKTSLLHFFYGATPLSLEGKKLPEYAVYSL